MGLIDGKYRIRRGKLVEVPEKWRGNVTSRQTIRGRASKLPAKLRRHLKRWRKGPDRPRSVEQRSAIEEY